MTTRGLLMDYEKERESVSSQEKENGELWRKIWEELHELVKKRLPGGSGKCTGASHQKGKETYVAV